MAPFSFAALAAGDQGNGRTHRSRQRPGRRSCIRADTRRRSGTGCWSCWRCSKSLASTLRSCCSWRCSAGPLCRKLVRQCGVRARIRKATFARRSVEAVLAACVWFGRRAPRICRASRTPRAGRCRSAAVHVASTSRRRCAAPAHPSRAALANFRERTPAGSRANARTCGSLRRRSKTSHSTIHRSHLRSRCCCRSRLWR